MNSHARKNRGGGSGLCYMWFLAICPLSTPPTLLLHILMSYKDTLSPLSPSPLGNCKNHNNQSVWKPTLSSQLLLPLELEATLRAFQTILPFWLCRAAPFPRPPPPKVFSFHHCWNVFRETFISEQPVTRDCTGGHFTGLVRENRKRELHYKRMTFTCIFTFICSCCRIEPIPSDSGGRLERSQADACITVLLA